MSARTTNSNAELAQISDDEKQVNASCPRSEEEKKARREKMELTAKELEAEYMAKLEALEAKQAEAPDRGGSA
jgi:hypothetical protein